MRFTREQIESWGPQSAENLRRALDVPSDAPGRAQTSDRAEKQEMVKGEVIVSAGRLVVVIPCVTRSEANESKWTRKMRRKLSAKAATREILGCYVVELAPFVKAYYCQHALRVTFTRLGGRRLDPTNLPTSMKSIEDVLAGALLADDGSPLWMPEYHQIPGGKVGVRIEIEVVK